MKKVIDFLRNLFIDGEVKFTTTSNKTKIKNFSNVQLINECLILESELNNNLITIYAKENCRYTHTFKSACIKNNKLIIIDSVGNSNDYPVKDIISINVNGEFDKFDASKISVTINGPVKKVKTTSGNISIHNATMIDKVESTSGYINMNGNVGTANTVSGSITANSITSAKSVSGNIKI